LGLLIDRHRDQTRSHLDFFQRTVAVQSQPVCLSAMNLVVFYDGAAGVSLDVYGAPLRLKPNRVLVLPDSGENPTFRLLSAQ
jgi:hypothetical protein